MLYAFVAKALKRKGFGEAYEALDVGYALVRAGRHSPSVTTLKKYAHAVWCDVEIRLVPATADARA